MDGILLPSASAMGRAMACPEGFALPIVDEVQSSDAEHGDAVHEYLKEALPGDRQTALASVPEEHLEACQAIDLSKLPRGGSFELAIAWDPETDKGRILGHDIKRRYEEFGADRTREVCMSLDISGLMADRRAAYFDVKTGWATVMARDSWQLRTGAIGLCSVVDADEALTGHLIVHGGEARWDIWEIDRLALARYKAEVRGLCRRIRSLQPTIDLDESSVAEGEHCRYCPHFLRCPAKMSLVREIAQRIQADFGQAIKEISPVHVAYAWNLLDRYDAVSERSRAQMRKLAECGPIDLGNGMELRLAPGRLAEKLEIKKAAKILSEEGASYTPRSKKALLEVVEAHAEHLDREHGFGHGGPFSKRVMERMRAEGALVAREGETKVRVVRKERR